MFMGINIHLLFLFRTAETPGSSDYQCVLSVCLYRYICLSVSIHRLTHPPIVLVIRQILPRAFLQTVDPLAGVGEECYVEEKLEESVERGCTPCFPQQIGRIWQLLPQEIYPCFRFAYILNKELRIVAGPVMPSEKDFVFLCPSALTLVFLLSSSLETNFLFSCINW